MKKRIIAAISIVSALAVIIAVAINIMSPGDGTKKTSSQSNPEEDTIISEVIANEEDKETAKQTLLIYMIGSDLESRSGAGTEDLKELESSGIDLKKINVVVCAGGSTRWHNDVATNEKNTILHLTKNGFKTVKSTALQSMGTVESLSEFLNYGYENYPADSFALIMWDHGNGPVIGYGKDMLFDNDSLTLSEMRQALSSSPFNSYNKLSWVGFDACLMSSAELVCVWDDYAKYLVASQEVEPAFGWNYKVFGSYGKNDTKLFLSKLIDKYISTCRDYYEKKGYADRDTTLACMDLSYASELNSAINTLFGNAGKSVTNQYDLFALRRVETRALGRSSTGSEYDLVDLNDMAVQLGDLYPEETKALQDVISKMVIKNGSTASGCSGLSLYYPFYNKYYYEESWGSTYENLGIFPSYGDYIDRYGEIWLKSDKLMYASSSLPEAADSRAGENSNGKLIYKLGLTKEQNETFADAKFYILKKISNDLYHPVMSSGQVTNTDGILTAEYDGKAIYAVDSYGRSWIPVTLQHDTVDYVTRYTVPAVTDMHTLINPDINFLNYHLELNNMTDEIAVTALLPREKAPNRATLSGGKLEEVNEEDFLTISFVYSNFRYLTRYDNNAVKPLSEWIENGSGEWLPFAVKDKISFEYKNLDADQYYIMFEITDTQGGKYCSEPLKTYIAPSDAAISDVPVTVIDWTEGEEICIYNDNGIELYLKKDLEGRSYYNEKFEEVFLPTYKWSAKNNNDFPVHISFDRTVLNSSITTKVGNSFYLDAKEYTDDSPAYYSPYVWNIDTLCNIGVLDKIESLEGFISITNEADKSTILSDTKTKINISGEASLGNLSDEYHKTIVEGPYMGALAEEQVLFEDNELRITLLYFGDTNLYTSSMLCYENLSDNTKEIEISSISVNGITVNNGVPYPIYPHSKYFTSIDLSNLEKNGITEIGNVNLTFGIYDGHAEILSAPDKTVETKILFKESAKIDENSKEENIIYDENGIRIALRGYGTRSSGSSRWIVDITNNSDEDVYIKTDSSNVWIGAKVKKGQRTSHDIDVTGDIGDSVSFKLIVHDITETKLLFVSDKPITLYTEKVKSDVPIHTKMNSEESIKILEYRGISIYLKNKNYAEKDKLPDYYVEVQNNSDMDSRIHLDDITVNENLFLRDYTLYANAGQAKENSIFFEVREYTENKIIDEINSISFNLSIEDGIWSLFTLTDQEVVIELQEKELQKRTIPEQYGYDEGLYLVQYIYQPFAKNQVLLENDSVRISLINANKRDDGRGKDYSISYTGYVLIENLSSSPLTAKSGKFYVNDIEFGSSNTTTIPEKTKVYKSFCVYEYDFSKYNINSIDKMEFDLNVWYDYSNDKEADFSKLSPIIMN